MEGLRLLFSTTPRDTANYLTISCATIPPILMPITWRSLLFTHPRWLHTSRVSFANSDVEYRMTGLSLSPIPLLSKIRQEYFSGCAWPKSFNWRCQYHLKPPSPVIHYHARELSHKFTLKYVFRPTPRTSKHGRLTYYKMFGSTTMNFVSNIEGPATANGHRGEPLLGWLEIVDHIFKCGVLDYLSRA